MTGKPDVLRDTIVLSFRTLQADALLLYIHDHMGNFVQLELRDGNSVVVSYNNVNEIVECRVSLFGKS